MGGRFLLILLIHAILLCIGIVNAQRQTEQEILSKIIGNNYDKRIRPINKDNPGEPVSVSVNLYVRSIDTVDESKMEYSVQLSFRQEWKDWRLNFSRYNYGDLKYILLTDVDQIWIPDTFFSNEKESHLHHLMVPNNFVRIYANGDIMYSARLSMTLNCTMDLRRYPFDDQTCSMRLASYGYTTNSVKLSWKEEEPVQVTKYLALPRFTLTSFDTDTCDSFTTTGSYSCLRLDFKFHRAFHYYLIQVYIPCFMMVAVSWLSFWLDRKAITARTLIGISTLLVMAVQVANFNQRLPPVSYTKAMDMYTGMCLTFVFSSLIELVVVNYLARSEDKQNQQNNDQSVSLTEQEEEIPLNHITTTESGDVENVPEETNKPATQASKINVINRFVNKYMYQFTTKSEKIDGASRILFPSGFLLFLVIYLISCL